MDKTIVFTGDMPEATLLRAVRRGDLVRLAQGVYTSDTSTDPAVVVKREWHRIVGHLYPGAVITDRSALTGGPVDSTLYLSHPGRERSIELPGLTVRARSGAGPVEGDAPLPDGLWQASKGRALVENTRPSRARGGRAARTLTETELGDWIDRLAMIDGPDRLKRFRAQGEAVAEQVGASADGVALVASLVGVALGTKQADTASAALTARQAGLPYDHDRMRLFGLLIDALRESAPQSRPVTDPADPRYATLPFYEAYFSNFIEGTEFELADARAIVYEDVTIPNRSGDSHDLTGTYVVVSDLSQMQTLASSEAEFTQLLQHRHGTLLAGRPDKRPGQFKETANRAGNTSFVLPGLVVGTLRAGWSRLGELDTAFERAVYMMFLVAEVHPFEDGNGRIARVMMNAELVAGGQSRIIVPTVFRDDYLGSLRRLSRQDDPSVLIKALRYAHDYTSQVRFDTHLLAEQTLRATNAFNEPQSDDRLILPRRVRQEAAAYEPGQE